MWTVVDVVDGVAHAIDAVTHPRFYIPLLAGIANERFVIYPPTTKTLSREITLSPHEGGIWCSVRSPGGVQSGPVRIW